MTIAGADPNSREFEENLSAFFEGRLIPRNDDDLSSGPSDEQVRARKEAELEAVLAVLDDRVEPTDAAIGDAATVRSEALTNEEPTFEIIWSPPVLTPYDKARQLIADAEHARDQALPNSDEYHQAMGELARAKRAEKTALERDSDPEYRKRRAVDVWRAGEGREEYNAGRRKVRSKPNARSGDMSAEEWAQHKLDKNAENVWKNGRRKAGWSEAQIEAGLPGWRERRLAKKSLKQQW